METKDKYKSLKEEEELINILKLIPRKKFSENELRENVEIESLNADMIKQISSLIEIKEPIYQGNNSFVYSCKYKKNPKANLVVKFIHNMDKIKPYSDQINHKNSAEKEITIQINCRHKYIIPCTGYFKISDDIYALIQEQGNRGNLLDYLNNLKNKFSFSNEDKGTNNYPEALVCYLAFHMVPAIKYIKTQNIVHQGIDITNFVVTENHMIKLTDFSDSVKLNDKEEKFTYKEEKDLLFSAPEKLMCDEIPMGDSSKSDYYSLGILLYMLIFGCLPFEIDYQDTIEERLEKMNNKLNFDPKIEISEDLKNFLTGLLEFDYKKRMNIENIIKHEWMKKCNIIYSFKENYGNMEKYLHDLYNESFINLHNEI
jgi:serine/threonine protein kinase